MIANETTVHKRYKFTSRKGMFYISGIYDEFIYNHWVDATAGGVLIP